MAINSSKLNVTDLDFDNITSNLKQYLQGQETFKDYNFEGSTLAVLIDLLAYASHIGAINLNIAASELFLDSAQIRKNVVSRAKDLGFTPTSEAAAAAYVNITLNNVKNADGSYPTTTEMIIPKGSIFNTVFDGTNYSFVTSTTTTPTQDNLTYTYDEIELVQGTYIEDIFVFDSQIKNSKFVVSNARVDKNRVTVNVTSGGITSAYALSTDVSTIKTTSKVYYTQENEEGFVEIYFGDNTLGAGLKDGDTIAVEYIVVDTVHANGAKTFSMQNTVNGFSNSTITLITAAAGGAEKESIESIKFKANKFYTSQNRLVTLNDYKAKVAEYYPNADAVAVWGGEDNDPPEYGKVFISLKPNNSDYLSSAEKSLVKNNLNRLNMITVRPTIVDAEIIKILITTVFKYNANLTALSTGEVELLVNSAINQFDTDNLNNFDSIFRHSNLVKAIDAADTSILSNITNLRLKKNLPIVVNSIRGYINDFGNTLYNPQSGYNKAGGGITTTTGFYVSGDSINIQYFDDDGSGAIRRYYVSGSVRVYTDNSAGVVDYGTGKYSINAINITSTVNVDSSIDFTIIPSSQDVVATRGKLLDISPSDISVAGEIDTIASGESSAGVGFTSTSSTNY